LQVLHIEHILTLTIVINCILSILLIYQTLILLICKWKDLISRYQVLVLRLKSLSEHWRNYSSWRLNCTFLLNWITWKLIILLLIESKLVIPSHLVSRGILLRNFLWSFLFITHSIYTYLFLMNGLLLIFVNSQLLLLLVIIKTESFIVRIIFLHLSSVQWSVVTRIFSLFLLFNNLKFILLWSRCNFYIIIWAAH
jgi:hypothetical protein